MIHQIKNGHRHIVFIIVLTIALILLALRARGIL